MLSKRFFFLIVVTHDVHSQGLFKLEVSTMRTDFQRDPGMYSNAIERNSFSAVSTSFLTTLKLQHFNNFIFELNPLIILPFPPFFSEQKISQ